MRMVNHTINYLHNTYHSLSLLPNQEQNNQICNKCVSYKCHISYVYITNMKI